MTKLSITLFCTAIINLLAFSTATAESALKLGIGAAVLNTSNNLSVTDENKKLNDLDSSGKTTSKILPLVELLYTNKLTQKTSLYAGMPIGKDSLSIKLGVKHHISRKEFIDVAAFVNPLKTVWKNPYKIGVDRSSTTTLNAGVELKYNGIAGTNFSVEYKLNHMTIDDDEIGDLDSDLKRGGQTHKLKLSYRIPLIPRKLFIEPSFDTEYADIEGSSNAYHKNGAGVQLMLLNKKWMFISGLSINTSQYFKEHAVFDQTRHETGYGWFNMFKYEEPFQIKKTYITLMGLYSNTNANIDFFDKQTLLIGGLVGYKF